MSYSISSETLITNYFARVENSKEVSLSILTKISNKIISKFSKKGIVIFIEWNKDSIRDAVLDNLHYFSMDENYVIRFIQSNKNNFFIDFYAIYDSKFDNPQIKYEFCNIFDEVLIELGLVKSNK